MLLLLHLSLPALISYCFWRWIELAALAGILPQASSALSIFVAAVLVRLARGMPTLDWKSIPVDSRKKLTGDLLRVAQEYAGLLLLLMLLLVVVFTVGSGPGWIAGLETETAAYLSGGIGGLAALCLARFGYVVWRDLDIVVLQKAVIDKMTEREVEETDAKRSEVAQGKIEQMRRSYVSGGPPPGIEPFDGDSGRSG